MAIRRCPMAAWWRAVFGDDLAAASIGPTLFCGSSMVVWQWPVVFRHRRAMTSGYPVAEDGGWWWRAVVSGGLQWSTCVRWQPGGGSKEGGGQPVVWWWPAVESGGGG